MMQDFFRSHYHDMHLQLETIKANEPDVIKLAKESTNTVQQFTTVLKKYVLDTGFHDDAEEINFFKVTKPKFYSQLIYFSKLLQLELARPTSGVRAQKKYLKLQMGRVTYFFKKYHEFYGYIRSGANYLDNQFFLRKYQSENPHPELDGIDKDQKFSTSHDYLVAKIQSNEMIDKYIIQEAEALSKISITPGNANQSPLSWTASKASLTELLYSLFSIGAFNNGNTSIQQIASYLETVFNIKLGNYYRSFQELRIRKKNRTMFLDELKDKLTKKMDYDDLNPQG